MPIVSIKTGELDAAGQEIVLTEYLCDWPEGCANNAEDVIGRSLELGIVCVMCPEHAARIRQRSRPDAA